jgi:hypothetical protein
MPKIVILGSLRFDPYQVTVPQKVKQDYHNEDGYRKACERIYPAIDDADLILVYAPDGIGEHTKRDLDYARSKGKKFLVFYTWSS